MAKYARKMNRDTEKIEEKKNPNGNNIGIRYTIQNMKLNVWYKDDYDGKCNNTRRIAQF